MSALTRAAHGSDGPRESLVDRALRYGVFPFHERVLRGRQIWKHRRFIDASQWWSREQLKAHQWEELRRLLEHAYAEILQGLPADLPPLVPVWDQVPLERFHAGYVATLDLAHWDQLLGLAPPAP